MFRQTQTLEKSRGTMKYHGPWYAVGYHTKILRSMDTKWKVDDIRAGPKTNIRYIRIFYILYIYTHTYYPDIFMFGGVAPDVFRPQESEIPKSRVISESSPDESNLPLRFTGLSPIAVTISPMSPSGKHSHN